MGSGSLIVPGSGSGDDFSVSWDRTCQMLNLGEDIRGVALWEGMRSNPLWTGRVGGRLCKEYSPAHYFVLCELCL